MAQFVLKIEKLSHIMGPRGSQDLRSPSPTMAPDLCKLFFLEKFFWQTGQGQLMSTHSKLSAKWQNRYYVPHLYRLQAPQVYCFPSTTITYSSSSMIMFSLLLLLLLLKSIVLNHRHRYSHHHHNSFKNCKRVSSSVCNYVSGSEEQSSFSSTVSDQLDLRTIPFRKSEIRNRYYLWEHFRF